jgi:hypothetical protein
MARELLVEQALGRQPAPRQALELTDLAGLQAVRVAENRDGGLPRGGRLPTPSI